MPRFPHCFALCLLLLCGCPSRSVPPVRVPPAQEDPPLSCPLELPPDPHAAERGACTFLAGATAEETLGISRELADRLPIRHVIVVMRENRSFDHLLGEIRSLQPEAEEVPASFSNPDTRGQQVARFHAPSTCLKTNPSHQWEGMHEGVHGGAMDGFVKNAAAPLLSDGHEAMSYFDERDLPFETWLASTFALNDRHFAPLRSGTFPNRLFMLLATNDGVRQTALGARPKASTPTIFQSLSKAGLSWGAYGDGRILSDVLGWEVGLPGCHPLADFFTQLDAGTLPNVTFVDAIAGFDDDHPPADVQRGEAWVRRVYQRVVRSPQWPRTAMVWTYDEGGGFADHVPPPDGCVPRPGTVDATAFERGVRVPFVVISPWARPHFVSHVVQDHTAITRFIETIFGLPALTARDANSTALLELFDFSSCTPPMLQPPPAPNAGTGGCR